MTWRSTVSTRALALAVALWGCASEPVPEVDPKHADHGDHGAHEVPSADNPRFEVQVEVPAVSLVRQDGEVLPSAEVLGEGDVVVQFIFTTCPSVCPVLSAAFSQAQEELDVDFVSLSTDPEVDTPQVLAAYGERYGAGPRWSLYTGTAGDSVTLQQAFGVYQSNKMRHAPATFVRHEGQWSRIDGYATVEEIARELR